MAAAATVIAFLAIAGAVASWIAGATFHYRAGAAAGARGLPALAGAAFWPFAGAQRPPVSYTHLTLPTIYSV